MTGTETHTKKQELEKLTDLVPVARLEAFRALRFSRAETGVKVTLH